MSSAASGLSLFISYASVNRVDVLAMVDALRERQIDVWVDLEGITAGESYGPEIVEGIQRSDAVVLMCTNDALASRNVRQEIQLAWRYQKPIIPVLLEQVAIPDELAYWLEGAQWIDTTVLAGDIWIDRAVAAMVKRGVTAGSYQRSSEIPDHLHVAPIRGNLDSGSSRPIGRETELRRLVSLVSNSRIVTIAGPGGVGKTTLALEAGRRTANLFADGVWFVDAAASTNASEIFEEIATALGIQTVTSQSLLDQVLGSIGDQRLLLILDNLEQNPEAGAGVLSLVDGSDGLSVLVTSRVSLKVPRESAFPLSAFETETGLNARPAAELAQLPAIALFVARAQEVRPEFTLTDGNAGVIAEICNRLEGLPLAIELAAARSRLLPPAAILERLGTALDLKDRTSSVRSDRQQTLRATIRWSYDLLEDDVQTTFRELAVCEGGFTAEAAEGICTGVDALDDIDTLLEHHLVREQGSNHQTEVPRFRMLDTVRAFAHETLDSDGQLDLARASHLAWYLGEIQRVGPILETGSDSAALDALTDDHVNIRSAFAFALERSDVEAAAELALGMVEYWLARGNLHEGVEFTSRCIEADPDIPQSHSARLYQTRALLYEISGDLEIAVENWQQAVDAAETLSDGGLLASALGGLGTASEASGDYDKAISSYLAALGLHREAGNDRGIAASLHYLGSVETLRGNYPEAQTYSAEAILIWRRLGEMQRLAYSIQQDGILSFLSGDYAYALERYEETLGLVETIGDKLGIGNALINIGSAQEILGDFSAAVDTLTRARSQLDEMGDRGGKGYADYLIGHVGRQTGNPLAVVRLTEARSLLLEAGDLASVALVDETLAGIAVERGDKAEAEQHFANADRARAATGAAVPGSRVEEVRRDRERLAEL